MPYPKKDSKQEKLSYPLPDSENKRLKALQKFQLLDPREEESLNRITRIAAALCETPVSLITLVDEDHQWFASCHGTDLEETDRSISFCTHTILEDSSPMIIPDAEEDSRFQNNPLVTGEQQIPRGKSDSDLKIKSYAGVPLETEDGYRIGTLCVFDNRPRDYTDKQIKALKDLSAQAMEILESRLMEHQFNTILEIGSRMKVILEPDGTVINTSRTYSSMTGHDREDLIGKKLWNTLPWKTSDTPKDLFKSSLKEAREGSGSNFKVSFDKQVVEGEKKWFQCKLTPVTSDGSGLSILLLEIGNITEQRNLKKRIRQEKQKFQELVETLDAMLYITNPEVTEYLYVSPGVNHYFGRSQAAFLESMDPFFEALHPADREKIQENVNRLRNGEPVETEYRIVHQDGDIRWRWDQIKPLYGETGDVTRIVGISRDITDRKEMELELQMNRERLSLAKEAGGIGLWDWDIDQEALFWNDRMQEIFGHDADAYDDFIETVHPEDREKVNKAVQKSLENQDRFHCEYRIQPPETDVLKWVDAHAQVLLDHETNEPERMIGTVIDITDRKNQEAYLKEKREEAKRANAQKTRFLARVSHDMRAPIGSITNISRLLQENLDTTEHLEDLKTIEHAGTMLNNLINDILDLEKAREGKLSLKRKLFSPSELVEKSLAMISFRASKKNLRLYPDIAPNVPEEVVGDPNRIQQILINLVTNALKFTEEGEVIAHVRSLDDDDKERLTLRFEVTDTGPGIPEEEQDRIFNSFDRGDGQKAIEEDGVGLGLAICIELVEEMEGRMGVESSAGEGSTFWFSIPFERPEDHEKSNTSTPGESADPTDENSGQTAEQTTRIAILDDSESDRRILTRILDDDSLDIHEFGTSRMFLEWISSSEFNNHQRTLIFLDYKLPKTTGVKVLQEMQEQIDISRPKIFILTGQDPGFIEEKPEDGIVSGWIQKPPNPEQIRDYL